MQTDFQELARGLLLEPVDEAYFAFCAQDVSQYICAYCGTDAVPPGSETLAAKMLVSIYNRDELPGGAVRSLTRGDFSINFTENGGERFSSFDERLNAFRKLKWR